MASAATPRSISSDLTVARSYVYDCRARIHQKVEVGVLLRDLYLVFEGNCHCRSHYAEIVRGLLQTATEEQAHRNGRKGHASQIDNEARLIEAHAIVPMPDRHGSGCAADGIRRPRQSVQNGEMPAAKVVREQIRRNIRFAAQTYAENGSSNQRNGRCACESEDESAYCRK